MLSDIFYQRLLWLPVWPRLRTTVAILGGRPCTEHGACVGARVSRDARDVTVCPALIPSLRSPFHRAPVPGYCWSPMRGTCNAESGSTSAVSRRDSKNFRDISVWVGNANSRASKMTSNRGHSRFATNVSR